MRAWSNSYAKTGDRPAFDGVPGTRHASHIAGHIVAEFPHARLPGAKQLNHISPENPDHLREPDLNGDVQHWILEIHLVDPAGQYGGFYERLMLEEVDDRAWIASTGSSGT